MRDFIVPIIGYGGGRSHSAKPYEEGGFSNENEGAWILFLLALALVVAIGFVATLWKMERNQSAGKK